MHVSGKRLSMSTHSVLIQKAHLAILKLFAKAVVMKAKLGVIKVNGWRLMKILLMRANSAYFEN